MISWPLTCLVTMGPAKGQYYDDIALGDVALFNGGADAAAVGQGDVCPGPSSMAR